MAFSASLAREASVLVEQWVNGSRNECDDWIGNSATRLLHVLDQMAALHGSGGAREFTDAMRYRRFR